MRKEIRRSAYIRFISYNTRCPVCVRLGLRGKYRLFTIDNPNAIASCGCGSSFRTAKNAGTPEEC